jgi:hypothetical protein
MTTEKPIVCTLPAAERRARGEELRRGLMRRVRRVEETEHGALLRFALRAEIAAEVREFVAFESACCEFLTFEVTEDGSLGEIRLELGGPPGTKGFLAPWLSVPHPPQSPARWIRAGIVGVVGAAGLLVCCATPMLALALGALGVGGAIGRVGPAVDLAALGLLASSGVALAVGLVRRRSRSAGCDC